MTDLVVTAADVRPLPGCIIRRFTAGGTVAVGSPVYLSDNAIVGAADGSTITTVWAIGVLVSTNPSAASQVSAASGDAVDVVLFGPVAGYTCVTNTLYYVDDDAGVIADAAGTKDCIIGIGLDTQTLLVHPQYVDFS